MGKKIVIAIIILIILLTCSWYGYRKYSDYKADYAYNRQYVVAGTEFPDLAIYIEPDDTATRAAANYLAFSLEEATGIKAEIVAEQGEQFQGIRILCGTDIPEEPEGETAEIEFIATAEAANDSENTVYSVRSVESTVSILRIGRRIR